jgi:hypothetical protein
MRWKLKRVKEALSRWAIFMLIGDSASTGLS